MADEMGVPIPALGAPIPDATAQCVIIEDVIDPRYPTGATLVFQRPGELGVVVTVEIPKGSLVMYIPPEPAAHVRQHMHAMQRAQREQMARINGALGRRG